MVNVTHNAAMPPSGLMTRMAPLMTMTTAKNVCPLTTRSFDEMLLAPRSIR